MIWLLQFFFFLDDNDDGIFRLYFSLQESTRVLVWVKNEVDFRRNKKKDANFIDFFCVFGVWWIFIEKCGRLLLSYESWIFLQLCCDLNLFFLCSVAKFVWIESMDCLISLWQNYWLIIERCRVITRIKFHFHLDSTNNFCYCLTTFIKKNFSSSNFELQSFNFSSHINNSTFPHLYLHNIQVKLIVIP